MGLKCAIHQPNFFPWLGYFDKIDKADVFVFLDDVQNIKTGSNWFNRTKLNCFGKEKWLTCPITRPSGVVNINQVQYAKANWQDGFISVIQNYYQSYPRCKKVITLIKDLVYSDNKSLCELNIACIKYFTDYFGYNIKFYLKSELDINTKSNQMLVDICKALNANTYLCGGGSDGYLEQEIFAKQNINILFQDYSPKPYHDSSNFIQGLSIIDYLMWQI